jgi:hypothetical protein
MKSPTYAEIAQNYTPWEKYADPYGIDSQEKFNQLTVEEKIGILEDLFGLDTSEFEERE